MPRTARVVVAGAPHHVIQRGNRRQTTFFGERDYRLYRAIAAEMFANAGVEVWAYCLMFGRRSSGPGRASGRIFGTATTPCSHRNR
jgi:hypothetical protein